MGKTFAIIGYGYMGEALSKRLSGFGMNVIAYDKYLSNYENSFVKEVQLNEIFLNADFNSINEKLDIIGMILKGLCCFCLICFSTVSGRVGTGKNNSPQALPELSSSFPQLSFNTP